MPNHRRLGPAGLEPRSLDRFWRALCLGEAIVVSRALLHFERLERPPGSIDARMRRAIDLMARARAPFERAGLHLVWQARHVCVWSWDQDRLSRLGVSGEGWLVPEPVLDKGPREEGFVLIERHDGVEAQVWQNHALIASRFWASVPGEGEIERFRKACESGQADPLGSPTDFVLPPAVRLTEVGSRIRPVHAAVAAILFIGVPVMYAAGEQARLAIELSAAQREIDAFAEVSADEFSAQERYRAQRGQIILYQEALEHTNPLSPAADLAEAAEAAGAKIVMLSIEPGLASARIETQDEIEPAELAQSLEAQASLSNVRLTRASRGNGWDIEADLIDAESGVGS